MSCGWAEWSSWPQGQGLDRIHKEPKYLLFLPLIPAHPVLCRPECPSMLSQHDSPEWLPSFPNLHTSCVQGPPWTDAKLLCILVHFLRESIPIAQLMDQMAIPSKQQTRQQSPKVFPGLWRRGQWRASRHLRWTVESALKMFSKYNPFWLQSVVDISCTLTWWQHWFIQ